MNEDMLRDCPVEVQEAHWQQRDLLGVMEKALQLAIASYRSGRPPKGLPGTAPALDADAVEWFDYYVAQGSLVFHEQLTIAAA